MDRQLINDLYKDLDKEMPKGSDGIYFDSRDLDGHYSRDKDIGSFHYCASGINITGLDSLHVEVEKGRIQIWACENYAFRAKSGNFKGVFKWPSSLLIICTDSVPGAKVTPMTGLKKEVLEFIKIYGYHFADGEEGRFMSYNPYETDSVNERHFYIKKN